MKKFSTFLLLCILALTFCFGGAAYAQEEEGLPNHGITPDSAFYFADKWAEQLALMLTFKAENKVTKALQYAVERLAEVDAMLAQNKEGAAIKATNVYNNRLATAIQAMHQAGEKGIDTSETVALAASKHLEFLNDSMADAPENAQMILTQTRARASTCRETALRTRAQGNPEEAMRTNLMLMGRHLSRIRVMAAEEPESLGLQEELRGFERLGNLSEEISQIAKGLGKDTTVDQLVGQATASHLQVLAEVHAGLQQEQAQAQAQGAIEDAMQVCVVNHERVVNRLSNNDMLGGITEEAPIPEELPENVKQRITPGGSGRK